MKAVIALFILTLAPLLLGAEVPDKIKGTWLVTGYRFAGFSALSEKEAKSWIGKSLVIGTNCISLQGDRIAYPRVHYTVHATEKYFEGFHIEPSDVGYNASKVHEYEIMDNKGNPWTAPGSTLLILNDTEAWTCWDGVFFVLKRKQPNKPASATTALSRPTVEKALRGFTHHAHPPKNSNLREIRRRC